MAEDLRCPQCGYTNAPEARYCGHCGLELFKQTLNPGQAMNAGQYRIVRQLGKGGMGAIYLAQNIQAFDRLCVIKEMIAYYEAGEEQRAQERFEEEARTLSSLKHPGIPDMYGYFSENSHNYIVMEYIEGDNLKQMMEHRQGASLDLDEAVRYAVEVCRVLEYLALVQPKPVVHCDIKPENIIIERNSGQAVLVDFGTAKTSYAHQTERPDNKRPSVYGTVGYAAPELFSGRPVPKSDVFSLAATLYYVLTADDPRDHPFKWPHIGDAPAPLRLVIEQALANEANQRLDAEQFRRHLEAYRASRVGTVRPITFPDGNVATTVTGILDLSLAYWDYARQILYDGSLDTWLRHTLNDPISANHARDAVQQYPETPDAGLDTFVRSLSPRVPAPTLSLSPSKIDLGTLAPGGSKAAKVTLHNQGSSGSRGIISTSASWLQTSPTEYGLGPGHNIEIVAQCSATEELMTDAHHTARITVGDSVGQVHEVEIKAHISSQPGRQPKQPAQPPKSKRTKKSHPKRAGQKRGGCKIGIILLVLAILIAIAIAATYAFQAGIVPSKVSVESAGSRPSKLATGYGRIVCSPALTPPMS